MQKKKNMLKGILNEELSISNDVNNLTLKIKSVIGDDYKRNNANPTLYKTIHHRLNLVVFFNKIVVTYNDMNIEVLYHVLDTENEELTKLYLSKFPSRTNNEKLHLTFYFVGDDDKINWKIGAEHVQHEVEHLFQLYKKEKPILSDEKMKEYNKLNSLTNSDDFYEQVIGYTYYYYIKAERNAIINGIYRYIIDANTNGEIVNPLQMIKDTQYYNNIQIIKKVINDNNHHLNLENKLLNYNKTLKSFLRIANRMVDEYTKAFGRLLYKVKKDIEEKNKDLLINHNG